ncbi:MAG: hypothetical protein HYY08_03805 [Firmicutes bacterium]|nr:hypothetical protein [Bacillota bacterium]
MVLEPARSTILTAEESARGYSSYSAFSVERSEQVPPGAPFRRSGGRFVPVRHDGFVVGNGLVAAVLGWKSLGGVPMVSSMSFIDGCRTPASVGQVLSDEFVSEREQNPVGGASQAALRGCLRLLPAQDFVVYRNGEGRFASDIPLCVARRIRRSGVWVTACEDQDLGLEIVDLAPSDPPFPVVCRFVTVQTRARLTGAKLRCFLKDPAFSPAGGGAGESALEKAAENNSLVVWSPQGTACRGLLPGFAVPGSWVEVSLPDLGAGEAVSLAFYFALGEAPASAWSAARELHSLGPGTVVRETIKAWDREMAFDFRCDDERVEDLVETLQVLLLSERVQHLGFHGGLCRYPGSYVRDNYYALRGLLETGHVDVVREHLVDLEGRLSSGSLENHYHSPLVVQLASGNEPKSTETIDFWNDRNEVHCYAALMFRDYQAVSGEALLKEKALERLVLLSCTARTVGGLSMSHGDETYHYTTPDFWINSGSIDNSILALTSMRFLGAASRALGRHDLAAALVPLEETMSRATAKAWLGDLGWYPSFVSPGGTPDRRPMLNTLLFGYWLGFHDKWTEDGARCLGAVIRHLSMQTGLAMSAADFPIYTGNNPGMYLVALGETDGPCGGRAFRAALDLASSTGTYFEYYDVYEHRRFGETLRAMEGGTALTGMVDYLLGVRPIPGGVRVKPHLPPGVGRLELRRFKRGPRAYSLEVGPGFLSLTRHGSGTTGVGDTVLVLDRVSEVEFSEHPGAGQRKTVIVLRPAAEQSPRELEFRMTITGDGADALVTPGGFDRISIRLEMSAGEGIGIRQEITEAGVSVENLGPRGVSIQGQHLGRGCAATLPATGPTTVTAVSSDADGALISHFLTGEVFRVLGWVHRGGILCDADVEVTCGEQRKAVRAVGGRFEAEIAAPANPGNSEVQVQGLGECTSFDIQTLGREVLDWRDKALEGYVLCVAHRPGLGEVASFLAMEMSLLTGMRVRVMEEKLEGSALILRSVGEGGLRGTAGATWAVPEPDAPGPSMAQAQAQAGATVADKDPAPDQQLGPISGQVLRLVEDLRLYWKHVPLLTTDEWKIKAARYPMVVASRCLPSPVGTIPAEMRSRIPASLCVGGTSLGMVKQAVFGIDLGRHPAGGSSWEPSGGGDLSISVLTALPSVKQIVIACRGRANHYRISMRVPTNLRVVDPCRIPGREFLRWRGDVQTLSVTRDPLTLEQQVELVLEIDEGRPEIVSLPVIAVD